MELIDKSALVAEIEKRIRKLNEKCGEVIDPASITSIELCKIECKLILNIINTLEVKEVDLEKEKDDYWNKLCDSEFGELLERDAKWFDDIAKHFFELGLKTKGE